MGARLNAIGIVVSDMDATMRFYRTLGLDVPAEIDEGGHVEVPLDNGMRLMFDTVDVVMSFDSTYQPSEQRGRVGLAVECDSPSHVDELHTRLVGDGYDSHLSPWDAFWGQRYATVLDPDGITVDLYATLEPS